MKARDSKTTSKVSDGTKARLMGLLTKMPLTPAALNQPMLAAGSVSTSTSTSFVPHEPIPVAASSSLSTSTAVAPGGLASTAESSSASTYGLAFPGELAPAAEISSTSSDALSASDVLAFAARSSSTSAPGPATDISELRTPVEEERPAVVGADSTTPGTAEASSASTSADASHTAPVPPETPVTGRRPSAPPEELLRDLKQLQDEANVMVYGSRPPRPSRRQSIPRNSSPLFGSTGWAGGGGSVSESPGYRGTPSSHSDFVTPAPSSRSRHLSASPSPASGFRRGEGPSPQSETRKKIECGSPTLRVLEKQVIASPPPPLNHPHLFYSVIYGLPDAKQQVGASPEPPLSTVSAKSSYQGTLDAGGAMQMLAHIRALRLEGDALIATFG